MDDRRSDDHRADDHRADDHRADDHRADDDRVFKALADPTRRRLLDRLFERDGRTLGELAAGIDMTRFGVMKHLRVLEEADLIVARRAGREKLHYLNPVPIRLIHDRWVGKFAAAVTGALSDLKSELEARAAADEHEPAGADGDDPRPAEPATGAQEASP